MHRTTGKGNIGGLFTDSPPATCLTSEWLNALQEEICYVIEQAGLSVCSDAYSDTKDQLYRALSRLFPRPQYDRIVTTQAEFNALFVRQGANHYHIDPSVKSIYLNYMTGGYVCWGLGSFLSGGDTWAYVQTTNCVHIKTENGAYLNVGDTPFYLEVNTDDCKLDNVYIKGIGTSSSSISRSFLSNAYRITYDNCKTSDRYSSAAFYNGFEGKNSVAYDITCKFVNCSVFNVKGTNAPTTLAGFRLCYNLNNCVFYSCADTTGSAQYGLAFCYNVASCSVYDITSNNSGTINAFQNCTVISSCYAYSLSSTNASAVGFDTCSKVSGCFAQTIDTNGAASVASGFSSCTIMSACKSDDIDAAGGGTAEGFITCTYGSSLYSSEAVNQNNDWMNSNDAQVPNKNSTPIIWT